ncbi:MAG: hypothetical protein JRG90_17480 [Deltaproteobacteria bacterium]|nr:hypothetical protein [Deltaproteobacteria bacterium]
MLLAQGRFWRASLNKGAGNIALEIFKASLAEDLYALKDMKIEIPIGKWNLAVKHVHSDRKLLGGLLLDFANNKERVSAAVGNDRLLAGAKQRESREWPERVLGRTNETPIWARKKEPGGW